MKEATTMKAAGAIRIPVRRRLSIVPVMIVAGVALVAVGAAHLGGGPSPVEGAARKAPVERVGTVNEDWVFVLRADTALVLRHRPGLEPADFLRTHAFGWDGVTVREVLTSPALVKELRLQPELSPIELIRLEARGP
jgi:hypothetical protein